MLPAKAPIPRKLARVRLVRARGHQGYHAPGQLQLNWSADHTGWQLQAQSNNLAIGLGTNWVNVSSSAQTNQMSVPLNAINGAVFFRLVRPY